MVIYPALDLMDNKCVRLRQGKRDTAELIHENPVVYAEELVGQGYKFLHVVDLDSAFEEIPFRNEECLRGIVITGIKTQYGGGIRTEEDIRIAFDLGVERVVLSTTVLEHLDESYEILNKFDSLVVSLDIFDGQLMSRGWTQILVLSIQDTLEILDDTGVWGYIVTDVVRDGTEMGHDTKMLEYVLEFTKKPVMAAGGVRNMEDVALLEKTGCHGVIVGKAIKNLS